MRRAGRVSLSVSQVQAPYPKDFKQVPQKKRDYEGEKESLS